MQIIDFHTHVFHPKIAHLAIEKLENHYGYKWQCDGTLDDLNKTLDKRIYKAVVFATPTKPEQTRLNNDYLFSINDERLIVFGSLHPEFEDALGEINRVKEKGLRGFKFHPDFQGFDIDCDKALSMYDKIGSDFPIILHVGDKEFLHSSPEKLSRVLEIFPEHKFVAAHLGGYSKWNSDVKYLLGKNLWIDTSSALQFISSEFATEIIRKHGTDKVLFGTDYPSTTLKNELKMFNKLKLTKKEREDILFNNAYKLLKSSGGI